MHPSPTQPLPQELASPAGFREAFGLGLSRMLREHEDLGVHILVLANAAFEADLWTRLRDELEDRHHLLGERIRLALRQGRRPQAPEDDLLVFLQLLAMGFGHVAGCESRPADGWEVQYNPVRALRPPRASGAPVRGLRVPYDADAFNFNRPFLARELFWSGALAEHRVDIFYNKFPFAGLHGLLVPEREREWPQFLTPGMHDFAWRLTQALGAALPGVALAYNSYGAHASVNHLHFQLFVRETPLPVEAAGFAHNGGDRPYPADCRVAKDELEAWVGIDELHARACPYNLIYRPGRMLLLARRAQGDYPLPAWSGGLAWYEMAGGASVFGRDDFERLGGRDLAEALWATRPA